MLVDKVDLKILNVQLLNSKTTYRDLAAKLEISPGTINNRLKKLEQNNIIKRYTVNLDYDKIGYDIEVLIFIKISKGNFKNVADAFLKYPNVYLIFDTTGDFDMIILARFKARRELDKFIKKIQRNKDVLETNTRLILKVYHSSNINLT